MTATYDPAEVERLVREAREDDRKMAALEGHERAPWRAVEATRKDIGRLRHYVTCIPADHACWSGSDMVAWSRLGIWTSEGVTEQAFAEAIARTRNNLGAMADQLEAARTEVDRIPDLQAAIGYEIERRDAAYADLAAARARIAELEGVLVEGCDMVDACIQIGDWGGIGMEFERLRRIAGPRSR